MNHGTKYLGQSSFHWTHIVGSWVHTHTQQIDCSIWTTKWCVKVLVINNSIFRRYRAFSIIANRLFIEPVYQHWK